MMRASFLRRLSPFLMLAVALVALAVFLAPGARPASAQITKIWSATLTVGDLSSNSNLVGALGCANIVSTSACSDSNVLTENEFMFDASNLTVTNCYTQSGSLSMGFAIAMSADFKSQATLYVGDRQFPVANAVFDAAELATWANVRPRLRWSVGDTVQVRMTKGHWTPYADPALVSNAGQARAGYHSFSGRVNAQGFTTGDSAGGYTLETIYANLSVSDGIMTPDDPDLATVRADLWSGASNGVPESKLLEFALPPGIATGPVPFKAPPNTTLAPNTTYHFVIYTTGDLQTLSIDYTSSNSQQGADADSVWEILDASTSITADNIHGSVLWTASDEVLQIAVRGSDGALTAPLVSRWYAILTVKNLDSGAGCVFRDGQPQCSDRSATKTSPTTA